MHEAVRTTLEAYIAVMNHPAAKAAKPTEYCLEGIVLLVNRRYVSGRAGGRDDKSGSNSAVVERAKAEGRDPPPASILHRLMEAMSSCCSDASANDAVQSMLVKAMTALLTCPKCGIHESTMLLAFTGAFHVYLVTKSAAVRDTTKQALWDMIRSVIGRMEAQELVVASRKSLLLKQQEGVAAETEAATIDDEETATADFPSQHHADSYMMFRSLCKMSSKELDAVESSATAAATTSAADTVFGGFFNISSAPSQDAMSLNGKILSLEMIYAAIDVGGDAFCTSPRFVYLVQHYLCNSLLKNCMSNHTQVAFFSQKIFLLLVRMRCPSTIP